MTTARQEKYYEFIICILTFDRFCIWFEHKINFSSCQGQSSRHTLSEPHDDIGIDKRFFFQNLFYTYFRRTTLANGKCIPSQWFMKIDKIRIHRFSTCAVYAWTGSNTQQKQKNKKKNNELCNRFGAKRIFSFLRFIFGYIPHWITYIGSGQQTAGQQKHQHRQ